MRTVALALCVVLVGVAPVVGAVGGGPASGAADVGPGDGPFASSPVDADRTVLSASVDEDGYAQWSVDYRVELTTDNETAAFESLSADIAANRSAYLDSFRDRMTRTVGTAENATGREMAVENLSVSTTTEEIQGYGVVTYSFRWTNFAAVDGDELRVGDALAGFFLEADGRLVLSWPDGYEATSVSPTPDDRSDGQAAWNGPAEFGPGGPSVVASPAGLPLPLIGIAVLVVGALLAGGAYAYRRRGSDAPDSASATAPAAQQTAPDTPPDDGAEAGAAPPDDELLSNEERVLRLLEAEGGRVKQQTVAQRLEWTDAKTSQVVGALREEDEIEVFRLGRENVIVDPEESEL